MIPRDPVITMAYGGYTYIDPKYKPDEKNDFIVLTWAKGSMPLERIAEALAAESSVGSWTRLKTMNDFVWKHYRARVFRIQNVTKNSGFIWTAYPLEHFDTKNIPQFQASVLGNLFGLKELEELYIFDIAFPKAQQKLFKGAYAGLEGLRKKVGTQKTRRPHIGTIVKPKVGLTPKEWANVAYNAYAGGLDLVKDDENLVDQDFCRWKERLHEVMKSIEKAEGETGQTHLYSSSVTDKFSRMVERVDYLNEMGLQKNVLVMMDVYILGMSALEEMLDLTRKYKLATHAHRAGFAAANRGSFGINFQIYEKFYRILGMDQLHIGTGAGKMEGSPLIIRRYHDIADQMRLGEKLYLGSLGMEFADHIKPILSIASGGVDAGKVDALVALHGNDVNIQAGAGVHGHPGGTLKGAISMKQAIDAIAEGIPLPEYAKTHKELKLALDTWGYFSPKPILKELEYEKKNGKNLTSKFLKKGRWGMELGGE
ncbi:MAG: ribulose-bisphosphate carboxylase large subunit [Candidatus Altiarchaeota archaeon]|nr:ribulose-bisphosphate carboxylase large subunit [Candidatus Altiarchaeota archaeon]